MEEYDFKKTKRYTPVGFGSSSHSLIQALDEVLPRNSCAYLQEKFVIERYHPFSLEYRIAENTILLAISHERNSG